MSVVLKFYLVSTTHTFFPLRLFRISKNAYKGKIESWISILFIKIFINLFSLLVSPLYPSPYTSARFKSPLNFTFFSPHLPSYLLLSFPILSFSPFRALIFPSPLPSVFISFFKGLEKEKEFFNVDFLYSK